MTGSDITRTSRHTQHTSNLESPRLVTSVESDVCHVSIGAGFPVAEHVKVAVDPTIRLIVVGVATTLGGTVEECRVLYIVIIPFWTALLLSDSY